ncbi:M23 family metallopeptidase [Halalkalibacter urbisdiaboli]|uniref:M23 family metallopeptidase n=1 Tax=Halalkalibacter urbisdiaboli TaxID=1960589 RepID=UPI000B44A18A|nr:M23 family metallopeptidase [Halalkalibacter urbisdiaboli]
MLDYIKRLCIALAIAVFIGMLFIGTTTSFAAESGVPAELKDSLIWPTTGNVSDTYGTREGQHYGIDIAAPEGTPVVSIADGVINKSYYSDTYGHVIFVEHENGLETVYAHLHQRYAKEGQAVQEGQKIGTVGNTGRSSGNHLHFEVHHGNWNVEKSESIDPFFVLSSEPEAIYAAVGGVPEELSEEKWEEEEIVYVMSHSLTELPTAQPQQKEGERITHTISVKEGDTLSHIAKAFRISTENLKEWNQLDSETIHPGDTLVMYLATDDVHIVQAGDTLSKLAATYKLSVETLMRKNGLKSDVIYPGTVLKIK